MAEIDPNILNRIKKVHFIGIGGVGMSGLAEYLAAKGYQVTGSDTTKTQITERLENFNIKISIGHNEANLPDDADLVVYTAAVKEDNEEYRKAKRLNIQMVKRAEMLGEIVNTKYLIAVSGTHGKTTTTAMIARVFIDNGYDPTVFVGGTLSFLEGGTSRIGESKYAIVEADEYDRSFHTLRPDIAVITNVEHDHSDIYPDLKTIKESFEKFIQNGKKELKIVAYGDDENVRNVCEPAQALRKTFYGFEASNNYRITDIKYENGNAKYIIDGKIVTLKIAGKHNVLNSAAAYAVSYEAGIDFDGFAASIKEFSGVQRRLELKYEGDIKIYDDYAHHPTEVKATLEAVKNMKPKRTIAVFQPHLYSRTNDFYKEFAKEFKNADVLLLAKLYPAREKPIEGVSSGMILDEFKKISKKEAGYIEDKEELYTKLDEIVKPGDAVLFIGAGDITNYCAGYVDRVTKNTNV